MTPHAPADLQRWSRELARDPASLAFLPLARAYRRRGSRDAARKLCLRGLEAHPEHVEAHGLLALLYLEAGERQRACDEWSTVLRLDPANFQAHRGMGFFYLERDHREKAHRHLQRAARERPDDPAVREALAVLDQRRENGTERDGSAAPDEADGPEPAATAEESAGGATDARDPNQVFAPLLAETPFLGGLALDARGLVVAATLADRGPEQAEALGAILGGAIEEARRTAELLGLGGWTQLLLDTGRATLHLAPLGGEYVLVFVAERDAPAGWVRRTAARATKLARGFLEDES